MKFSEIPIIIDKVSDIKLVERCPSCDLLLNEKYECSNCQSTFFYVLRESELDKKLSKVYGFKKGSKEAKEYFKIKKPS